jgi:hypothetical protein
VSISHADFKPADIRISGPQGEASSPIAGLIIRAQEPSGRRHPRRRGSAAVSYRSGKRSIHARA